MPAVRRPRSLGALALVVLVLGACRPDTVLVRFRPSAGMTYRYLVEVAADTVTAVEGRPARRVHSRFVLDAEHRVQSVDEDAVVVEVTLRTVSEEGTVAAAGARDQRLLVRLDRAGALTRVERVEGVPAERLGQVGLAAVFPAAAGAPPENPLAPGERWQIDDIVKLGEAPGARLRGRGRLASLGIVEGRDVATIESQYELPIADAGDGTALGGIVGGHQRTTMQSTHALSDGAIESASSRTMASFRVRIDPPRGEEGAAPVDGRVSVDIRSTTQRVR